MQDVLIVGAGPAGLYAAERLSAEGFAVTIVDRMPSPARKFLMAGRGGLNLTHSEDLETFVDRYRDATPFLSPMIREIPPEALRNWCRALGEDTFIGSSGRVFPKSMKASPLLRAWLHRLERNAVRLQTRQSWTGFGADGGLELTDGAGIRKNISSRAVLLALGGASWPKLGSDAAWVPLLETRGIRVNRFQPANCGFQIAWSPYLKERFAGKPLKRIALIFDNRRVSGEAMLSGQGLEGGIVYALSAELRERINATGKATFQVDLRPTMREEDILQKLARPRRKQSLATFLKKTLKLKPEELALLRESGDLPDQPAALAQRIKSVPLTALAPYAMDRAISAAGGVALDELDDRLMLKKLPGVFAAGEMLDWEAPTGGYLLQACFATAARAAEGISAYLKTGATR